MNRYKNILIVCDWQNDSRLLIKRALSLSAQNESALTIVQAFETPPFSNREDPSYDERLDALYQKGISKSIEELREIVGMENKEGSDVAISALRGNPAAEIIGKVAREGVDLVMIELSENDEDSGPLLSGLPFRLIRRCPSDVWAMKATPVGGFNRIVAAVDPRDPSEGARALNRKIVEIASSLALSEKSELHVLHASSFSGEAILRGNVDEEDLIDWLDGKKQKTASELKELLGPFEEEITKVHVHEGPAEGVLPLFIKHFNADLLVMGTASRTGISGFLIGNTAEKILHKVNCSVLTIKPDNFEDRGD